MRQHNFSPGASRHTAGDQLGLAPDTPQGGHLGTSTIIYFAIGGGAA